MIKPRRLVFRSVAGYRSETEPIDFFGLNGYIYKIKGYENVGFDHERNAITVTSSSTKDQREEGQYEEIPGGAENYEQLRQNGMQVYEQPYSVIKDKKN